MDRLHPPPETVGWALGDGREHGDDPAWYALEADALYDLLERQVIPDFIPETRAAFPSHGSSGCAGSIPVYRFFPFN